MYGFKSLQEISISRRLENFMNPDFFLRLIDFSLYLLYNYTYYTYYTLIMINKII